MRPKRKSKYTDIPELLDENGNYDNPDDKDQDSEEEDNEEDE